MKRFYSTAAIVIIFLFPAISANAKHALAHIDNIDVTIIRAGEEPNGLAWEKLKTQINNKLNKAGIKVFSPEPGVTYKSSIWPELKICVCLLKLEQSQQYVFHIQTLLAKNIYVSALRQKADVWKTKPIMQAVPVENTPAKVTEVALEQVDGFIEAWRAVNPKGVQFTDANQVAIRQKESPQPPAKAAATKYLYVASKNSEVFHKPECASAKRITPENLVYYKTREDAINDGKRPCKMCKP